MSAPTVERPGAPTVAEPLSRPLRIVAAIGRALLAVRRGVRRFWFGGARLLTSVGRSPIVAAPVAALSVAALSLALVGLVVAGAWWGGVEPPGPWQEALAITGSAWVVTYGVPVQLLGVDYSLIPWGLVVIPGWLAHQAGRWLVRVVRPRRWRTLSVTWALAVVWGAAIVGGVSVLSELPDIQTSARRAVVMALVVGALGVGSGMWRVSEMPKAAAQRIPSAGKIVVRASFIGFAALVGFATLALLLAAATSFTEITEVLTALEPTFFDAVVLLIASMGYLPTLIGWSVGYVVGAGVALGPDILVSPFIPAIPPTPLPAFPPLALVPEAAGPVSWVLPVLGVLSGALIGLAISRLAAREGPLVRMALAMAATIVSAAWVFALLWAASGSLGDGRLSVIGPDPSAGALLAGVGLVIGALPTSVLRARRRSRRLHVVDASQSSAVPSRADHR